MIEVLDGDRSWKASAMVDAGDEDLLDFGELVPAEGGTWNGVLFDNPVLGVAPQLTWTFEFPFREVIREHGGSPVSLTIDWMHLPTAGWRNMAGQSARCTAESAEASVYFFQHHRYTAIALDIVEQRDLWVQARARVSGDLDGLGINPFTADGWLRFTGIHVSLSGVTSAESAFVRLREFTAIEGLQVSPESNSTWFRFVPADF